MTAVSPKFSTDSIHQPFSWVNCEGTNVDAARYHADVMDAFHGISTCLQLIEMSNLDRETMDQCDPGYVVPTLNALDTSRLMRLAILVATQWGNDSEHKMRAEERCATIGGSDK